MQGSWCICEIIGFTVSYRAELELVDIIRILQIIMYRSATVHEVLTLFPCGDSSYSFMNSIGTEIPLHDSPTYRFGTAPAFKFFPKEEEMALSVLGV